MTLIEVLIAVSIVIVISTIGWASVEDAIELNDILAENDESTRAARVAMGRLRRELQLAYLTPNQNTRLRYWTVFVGEDNDPDELWFATLAHKRLYKDSKESDQAEITVFAERAPRDQGVGEVLYHRESHRIDEEPDEGGRVHPLAFNVRSFNLRYLDGQINEWKDLWSSENAEFGYRLPRAVEIGLVLLKKDEDDRYDREVPFLTTVMLEYADPVRPLAGSGLDALSNGADPTNPFAPQGGAPATTGRTGR